MVRRKTNDMYIDAALNMFRILNLLFPCLYTRGYQYQAALAIDDVKYELWKTLENHILWATIPSFLYLLAQWDGYPMYPELRMEAYGIRRQNDAPVGREFHLQYRAQPTW